MRPVKDRWTGPARTPLVSARPPSRDVARAGVEHANTGPAARGCRPRTDGLRGSIRRRDRSSRGNANGDAVPNHLPREGRLGPQITRPSTIGLTHPPSFAAAAPFSMAGNRRQIRARQAPFTALTGIGPAGSWTCEKRGLGRALAGDHPRTVAGQISTAPAINQLGTAAAEGYRSRSPSPMALRLIIAATATTAPQPPQISVNITPGSSACFATPWANA